MNKNSGHLTTEIQQKEASWEMPQDISPVHKTCSQIFQKERKAPKRKKVEKVRSEKKKTDEDEISRVISKAKADAKVKNDCRILLWSCSAC